MISLARAESTGGSGGDGSGGGRGSRREQVEQLLVLAEHLDDDDAALLRHIYDRGSTVTELARAARVNGRSLRHRVKRLLERLGSPMFRFVLSSAELWPAKQKRIADLIFLKGRSQRDVAAMLHISLHQVRTEIARIRVLFEQAHAANTKRW